MKIATTAGALRAVLARAGRVMERRGVLPVLEGVLVEAGADGRISVTATNMDLVGTWALSGEVGSPGAAVFPAARIAGMLAAAQGFSATVLEVTANGLLRMTVADGCGFSWTGTACGEATDWPHGPAFEPAPVLALEAEDWRLLLGRVRYAISTEATRYYLNGVFLHYADAPGTGELRAVATDGHRLARASMAAPAEFSAAGWCGPLRGWVQGGGNADGMILPRRAVAAILAALAEHGGTHGDNAPPVGLHLPAGDKSHWCRFEFGGALDHTLSVKVIDGTFPDYDRVIPAARGHAMRLERAPCARLVRALRAAGSDKARCIRWTVDGPSVDLCVGDAEGEARARLPVSYGGRPVRFGVNSAYLLETLAAFGSDTVDFEIADAGSPARVTDPADPGFLAVMMPMRV